MYNYVFVYSIIYLFLFLWIYLFITLFVDFFVYSFIHIMYFTRHLILDDLTGTRQQLVNRGCLTCLLKTENLTCI